MISDSFVSVPSKITVDKFNCMHALQGNCQVPRDVTPRYSLHTRPGQGMRNG